MATVSEHDPSLAWATVNKPVDLVDPERLLRRLVGTAQAIGALHERVAMCTGEDRMEAIQHLQEHKDQLQGARMDYHRLMGEILARRSAMSMMVSIRRYGGGKGLALGYRTHNNGMIRMPGIIERAVIISMRRLGFDIRQWASEL
jgi:hypothetical protein